MVAIRIGFRTLSNDVQAWLDDVLIGFSGVCRISKGHLTDNRADNLQLFSLGMNVPAIFAADLGFGRDMWSIPPDNITKSLEYMYYAYSCYMISECFCQLSILTFYLRLVVDKKIRMIVWLLIGFAICFGVANLFSMIFQCTPIHFFWDGWKGLMEGTCIDVQLFGFVRGGIELVLDICILALPLPTLAKLSMSTEKKIQIMSMFAIGFVITIVSCLRLWALVKFGKSVNPTCKCSIRPRFSKSRD